MPRRPEPDGVDAHLGAQRQHLADDRTRRGNLLVDEHDERRSGGFRRVVALDALAVALLDGGSHALEQIARRGLVSGERRGGNLRRSAADVGQPLQPLPRLAPRSAERGRDPDVAWAVQHRRLECEPLSERVDEPLGAREPDAAQRGEVDQRWNQRNCPVPAEEVTGVGRQLEARRPADGELGRLIRDTDAKRQEVRVGGLPRPKLRFRFGSDSGERGGIGRRRATGRDLLRVRSCNFRSQVRQAFGVVALAAQEPAPAGALVAHVRPHEGRGTQQREQEHRGLLDDDGEDDAKHQREDHGAELKRRPRALARRGVHRERGRFVRAGRRVAGG